MPPDPVSIVLDEDIEKQPKSKDIDPAKAKEKEAEPQYVKIDDLKKISQQLNGLSSALRTSEKEKKELNKKLDDLEGRLSGRNIKPAEAQDELDKLLEQGEWRKPVQTVARQAVEEILRRRDEEHFARQSQEERAKVLEISKQQVRDRYPDIDDAQSDTAKAYIKILNSKRHYLNSEFGPLLAMRDMEDELDLKETEDLTAEGKRRLRVNATSLRPGTPAKSTTITLTREQKEFCKSSGISEDSYLKTLKSMAGNSKEMD